MKKIDVREKRGSAKDLALTPAERDLLIKELHDQRHRIVFLLGCFAGLRVEEIAQMRFGWLEWSNFGEYRVLKIKIPLEDSYTRKVHRRDGSRRYMKFKQKKEWKTAIYIFDLNIANQIYYFFENNKDGLKMSRQNITYTIVSGRTVKGVWRPGHITNILGRKFTSHAMRSTFTNYFTQEFKFPNGERPDPMFVKTQLRHRDLRTTMKHYKTETIAQQEAYLQGVLK